MNTAIVTTSTLNRLAEVTILADSIAKHHPGQKLTCYLVETHTTPLNLLSENLIIKQLSDLKLTDEEKFCFKYQPFELCASLKPFAVLNELNLGADKIIHLDGDMFICAPFIEQLDHGSCDVLLTPHLFFPEQDINFKYFARSCSFYNSGFISVINTPTAHKLLNWWRDRLQNDCFIDFSSGIFVDQHWLSFAATLFDRVGNVSTSGINIGHWNIHEHDYRNENGTIIDQHGDLLRLMHFSGFVHPGLTRHPSIMTSIPEAIQQLAAEYDVLLKETRKKFSANVPYSFACFDDSTPITREMREALRSGKITSDHPFSDRNQITEKTDTLGADAIMEANMDYQIESINHLKQQLAACTQQTVDLQNHLSAYQKSPLRTFIYDQLQRIKKNK